MSCKSHTPCTTVRLPFAPTSVAVARKMLALDLAKANVHEDKVEDAKIVLSELVTNGVLHGQPAADGRIEVGWCLTTHHLHVSVLDAGKVETLAAKQADPEALNGRGLAIVDYMCESWEICNDDGTRLTAELSIA